MFSFRTGNTRGTQQHHADTRNESTRQPHEEPPESTPVTPHPTATTTTAHASHTDQQDPAPYCLRYFSVSSGVNHSGSRPSNGKNAEGFSVEPSLRSGPAK